MFRRISTSIRTKALSVDDWAALNAAYPSSVTMSHLVVNTTKAAFAIAAFTGIGVVCATDWLQKCRSAELQAKIDAKMENLMGKLSAIEEQIISEKKKKM